MSQTPEEPQAPQYGAPQQPQYGAPQPPQYGAPQPPYGGQQPPQYGAPAPQGAPVTDTDRQTWSMLSYLGAALFWWLGPLIVWLMYKDRDATIKGHAVYNLNWGITVTIGYVALAIIQGVVSHIFWPLGALVGLLMLVVWIGNLVLGIMGALAINKGQAFKYPFTLDLVK